VLENENFPDFDPHETFDNISCDAFKQLLLHVTGDNSNERRFFVRPP